MKHVLSLRTAFLAFCASLATLGLLTAGVTPAAAHGEKSQDAFARMNTVGWWDVGFSQTSVTQGDQLTISGTAKILESWPSNLSGGNPTVCYLTVVEPGAQFALRDRTINGIEVPQSFYCHKGGVYTFKETLAGRSPGDWHVHPGLAVDGSGTLIGPGQWIHVGPSASGFQNNIQLLSGGTIDLESYNQWFVVGFSVLTFILGLWWMIKWTWSKPTITRLAVSNQLPLNQDGGEAVGLITRRDHVQSAVIAGLTVLLLVAGLLYQQLAYKNTLPPQSDWVTPPAAAQTRTLAAVQGVNSTWDAPSRTLTLKVHVQNTSSNPIEITAFRSAYLTFRNPQADFGQLNPGDYQMSNITSGGRIDPGQTRDITVWLPGTVLQNENLVPVGKAEMSIGGLVELANSSGQRNFDTVSVALNILRL